MNRIKGFTLAEVLITLAIIGVVAALVIPSVITNYRKNLYVTQLKKEYNYITNAFHTAMARDGVTKLSNTKLFATIPDSSANISALVTNSEFKEEISKIFNIAQIYDGNVNKLPYENNYLIYKTLDGNGSLLGWNVVARFVCLADGACIEFSVVKSPNLYQAWCDDSHSKGCNSLKEFQTSKNTPTKYWQFVGFLSIDVNGFQKGPNQMGRDFFKFEYGEDGNLYPYNGADYAVLHGSSYNQVVANTSAIYWKYNNNQFCNPNSQNSGEGCAARIIEEGWKMNY